MPRPAGGGGRMIPADHYQAIRFVCGARGSAVNLFPLSTPRTAVLALPRGSETISVAPERSLQSTFWTGSGPTWNWSRERVILPVRAENSVISTAVTYGDFRASAIVGATILLPSGVISVLPGTSS